jgi:hypothetical protein
MLFCSTSARVAGSGTFSHSTGMAPMWRLTANSRAVSGRSQPGCGPWRSSQDASSPGGCPSRWMSAAPTCRRNTEARWLPLPGSRPPRCPRCCRSRSHKVALLAAVSACVPTRTTRLLPSLRTSKSSKKKVHPALGAVTGPAVPQPPRGAGQPGQQPVELLRSRPARHALGRGRARTDGRRWREFPGRGTRCAVRVPARGRVRGVAGRAGGRDGDAVPGGADGDRKASWGQGAQIPLAATVRPSEVACAIELRISSLPQTSASPYQDCRAPRSRRPGVATAAGNLPAARPNAAWIWPRLAAQYRSYFDVTLPVCPGKPGTQPHARDDGLPVQHDVALCHKRPTSLTRNIRLIGTVPEFSTHVNSPAQIRPIGMLSFGEDGFIRGRGTGGMRGSPGSTPKEFASVRNDSRI